MHIKSLFLLFSLLSLLTNIESTGWQRMPGMAYHISVGCDGEVWALNPKPYRWDNNRFKGVVGGGMQQIAVASKDIIYGIASNKLWKFQNGNNWAPVLTPSLISRVSVGINGDLWVITAQSKVVRYIASQNQWILIGVPSVMTELSFDSQSNQVVFVDKQQSIFRLDLNAKNIYRMPGTATKISIGCDGSLWVITRNQQIFQWIQNRWQQMPGMAAQISVGNNANVWIINYAQWIYRWIATADINVDMQSNGMNMEMNAPINDNDMNDGNMIMMDANDGYYYYEEENIIDSYNYNYFEQHPIIVVIIGCMIIGGLLSYAIYYYWYKNKQSKFEFQNLV